MLYTLCYPHLSQQDQAFIDHFRQQHDLPKKDLVKPHFTLVFGIFDLSKEQYREHVYQQALSQKQIQFICRYTMLIKEPVADDYLIFLVPDEGYSHISLLHDRLYQGLFSPYLRLDLPYIPHIKQNFVL